MGLLDAFNETWSQARETFGQGTPEDGSKFDGSSRLLQMKSSVEAAAPDSRWQGTASDAYAAANKEHAQVYGKLADLDKRMAAEVTNAANVVTTGRQNLDNVKSWVSSMAASIPDTDADERDRKLLPIVNKGVSQVSDIIQKSTNDMTDIRGRVQGIKGEYDALTNQKFAPGEKGPGEKGPGDKPDEMGNKKGDKPDEKDVHTRAEQDVHKTLAGDQQAAAQVDKVLSGIKPGQKLTEEQSAYLSQMQAQQKGMSVEALKKAEQRLGDHKGVIANSWQLMSNKDVQFSVTEPKVGALDDPKYTTRGGADLLPDSVRDVLQRADQTIVTDDRPLTKALAFGSELDSIADIVKDGNPAFQTGTELDRQMIVAADKAMDVIADNPRVGGAEAIQSLFEAVDDDHRIINDQVMGRNGVSADDFLHDVNAIDWPDNGKAAGHLFSWTNESHDAHLPEERALAAETADKYASYIGSHKPDLMGGANHHTLGQVNPELVRGYAHGLSPYIPEIAGLSSVGDDGKVFANFEPDKQLLDQPVAKGVFSVLSTDPEAYKEFHGAANAHALAASYSWAEDVKNGVHVSQNDPRLTDAQTLKGLSAVGTQQAAEALGKNAHEMWQEQKSAYELGQKAVTGGLGTIPGYGVVAGPSFDVFATVMEDSIIGKEPTGDHYTIPPASKAECARFALNALSANDVPLVYDNVDKFDPQKYFADPPQVAGTHAGDTGTGDNPYEPRPGYHPQIQDLPGLKANGVSVNDADSVLANVLNATVPGSPTDRQDATQSMYDKYDQVTQNPDPKIAEPPK
ncbi:TPR repeat region-containing protein [Mycobacterium dioxanotrophicus]|uniref:TPR repeat region-containing protein n=1 Tax=Mycobacterium dioxanotrophicus TaxID=482462 RepID=UPI0012FC8311|nr:EspA/EspE family type VII secretion system effector [Mycobacterium dioxanotrophicus]